MESVDKKETTNGYSALGYSAINGGRKENGETNPDNQNDEDQIRKDEAETNENNSNTQLWVVLMIMILLYKASTPDCVCQFIILIK